MALMGFPVGLKSGACAGSSLASRSGRSIAAPGAKRTGPEIAGRFSQPARVAFYACWPTRKPFRDSPLSPGKGNPAAQFAPARRDSQPAIDNCLEGQCELPIGEVGVIRRA